MGCNKSHLYGPQSPFRAQLSEGGQLSNTRAAVAAVDNSEREVRFEDAVFSTLLECTLDVVRAKRFG